MQDIGKKKEFQDREWRMGKIKMEIVLEGPLTNRGAASGCRRVLVALLFFFLACQTTKSHASRGGPHPAFRPTDRHSAFFTGPPPEGALC